MTQPDKKHRPAVLIIEGALLLTIAIAAAMSPAEAPSVRWQFQGVETPAEPFAPVPAATGFQAELTLPRRMHVYAFSWDHQRGRLAMFPSGSLRTSLAKNPLPAGTYQLPGEDNGGVLEWDTGDTPAPCTVVLIASDNQLHDVERDMATHRQVGNAAFPGRTRLASYAPAGGMEIVPSFASMPDGLLGQALRDSASQPDGKLVPLTGHDGIYTTAVRFTTEAASGEADIASDIQKTLGPLAPEAQPARPK